jgi:hypothetical protein
VGARPARTLNSGLDVSGNASGNDLGTVEGYTVSKENGCQPLTLPFSVNYDCTERRCYTLLYAIMITQIEAKFNTMYRSATFWN